MFGSCVANGGTGGDDPENAAAAECWTESYEAMLQRFAEALTSFVPPDENSIVRFPKGFSICPIRAIDQYFEYVAKHGRPLFNWQTIRNAFLWKLELAISDMFFVEVECLTDNQTLSFNDNDDLHVNVDFIMKKAQEFEGIPFTFQRLCELLMTPGRHYKRADKFLRALEKNVNVVSTITETGERVVGEADFNFDENEPVHRVEQSFFVQVDECDLPIETRMMVEHEQYNKTESNIESKEPVQPTSDTNQPAEVVAQESGVPNLDQSVSVEQKEAEKEVTEEGADD